MEDVTDADYMHAKRVCVCKEYHDFCFKFATLLLAECF